MQGRSGMAAIGMHGRWRRWRQGHLADGRSDGMEQCRRGMPGRKGRDLAGRARGFGHHGGIEQDGLRQLHAKTTAVALYAAILFATGRMRRCRRSVLDRRASPGIVLTMGAYAGRLRLGIQHQHCTPHPGWHHGCSHGAADPIQDQAEGKQQAKGEASHGPRLPHRTGA